MFTFSYNVSPEFVAGKFAEGKTVRREQTINLDPAALSEAQRQDLLEILKIAPDGKSLVWRGKRKYNVYEEKIEAEATDPAAFFAEVAARAAELRAWQKADAEADERRRQRAAADLRALAANQRVEFFREGRNHPVLQPDEYTFGTQTSSTLQEVVAESLQLAGDHLTPDEIAAVNAELERRLALKAADIEATRKRNAEAAAKREAGKEIFRQWALAHGSDLVKARIEEGMNWQELAANEFFAALCKELGAVEYADLGCDDGYDVKNATLEQIQALRQWRKRQPDATLRRCVSIDDEGVKTHRTVVQFEVLSPGQVYKRTLAVVLDQETEETDE